MTSIEYRVPHSQIEYEQIYELCYRVLLEPWNEPSGIEKAPNDTTETHYICVIDNKVQATCRLDRLSPTLGQIRFVAVDSSLQGKGYGRELMVQVENEAKRRGIDQLLLHSRSNAVMFYHNLGYDFKSSSFVWHGIQHYEMCKSLVEQNEQNEPSEQNSTLFPSTNTSKADTELYAALRSMYLQKGAQTTQSFVDIFLQDAEKRSKTNTICSSINMLSNDE